MNLITRLEELYQQGLFDGKSYSETEWDKLGNIFHVSTAQLIKKDLLEFLPEKYDGGVTFKKPDQKQLLEDGKTIGWNKAIDQIRSRIIEYMGGANE